MWNGLGNRFIVIVATAIKLHFLFVFKLVCFLVHSLNQLFCFSLVVLTPCDDLCTVLCIIVFHQLWHHICSLVATVTRKEWLARYSGIPGLILKQFTITQWNLFKPTLMFWANQCSKVKKCCQVSHVHGHSALYF